MGTTPQLLAPARMPRFGTHQPKVVKDPAATDGEMVSCPGSDPAWSLPFHAREAGQYQLIVRARGDLGGDAYPTVGVYLDNTEAPLGTTRLTGAKYHRTPIGTPFRLDVGWQTLTVRFTNDFYGGGKEDRNFYLDRYELVRVGDLPSAPVSLAARSNSPVGTNAPVNLSAAVAAASANAAAVLSSPAAAPAAPSAEYRPTVLYPANGAAVFGADAVVARVTGGDPALPPAWVDVLLDGVPQNVRAVSPVATDAILCPLLVREVAPGAHRLSVRVADGAGRTVDSPVQLVNVLPVAPAARGPYDRAVFLLDRLAFGPDPKEMAAVLTLGETVWLNNRLNAGFYSPTDQALLRIACTKYPRIDDENQGVARALTQWIGTDNPVRARFTAWAENHFSTWIDKTKAAPKWQEHLAFCRVGVAPFADLLNVSAHSPAMLVYLDQERSYAGKLNENYAREIMELHTLGVHAGYAQTDVTTARQRAQRLDARPGGDPQRRRYRSGSRLQHEQRVRPVQRLPLRALAQRRQGPQRVFGLEFPVATDPAARLRPRPSRAGNAQFPPRHRRPHLLASSRSITSACPRPTDLGGQAGADLPEHRRRPACRDADPCEPATPSGAPPRAWRPLSTTACGWPGSAAPRSWNSARIPDQPPKPDQIGRFMKMSGMGLFDRVTRTATHRTAPATSTATRFSSVGTSWKATLTR